MYWQGETAQCKICQILLEIHIQLMVLFYLEPPIFCLDCWKRCRQNRESGISTIQIDSATPMFGANLKIWKQGTDGISWFVFCKGSKLLFISIYLFPDSAFRPWQILCEERHYLDAVVWALSDHGGRLWHETKNDIYIVDPHGKIKSDELKTKLLRDEWTKESIPQVCIHEGPCKDKGNYVFKITAFSI